MKKQHRYLTEEEILTKIERVRAAGVNRLLEAEKLDSAIAEAQKTIVANEMNLAAKPSSKMKIALEMENHNLTKQIKLMRPKATRKRLRADYFFNARLPNLGRLLAKMRTELLPYDGNTDRSVVL